MSLRPREAWTGAEAVLVTAAGVLSVAAVASTAQHGPHQSGIAAAFCAFIVVGELVRVHLPGDREAAPLGEAVALAYALFTSQWGDPWQHGTDQVVAVTLVSLLVGALPYLAVGRPPRAEHVARQLLTVAFAAELYRRLQDIPAVRQAVQDHVALLAPLMVAVVASKLLLDAALAALVPAGRGGRPYRSAFGDQLRALLGLGSAIGASGMLIALAWSVMGFWALPVFCVPLLLTQFAFRRYAGIRRTYRQTIHALSRMTELGGYTETGHARRVSELAVAVGRELGMREDDLLELEYAALMHDIGQLSLTDPIPGGSTVMVAPVEQRRIAMLGAEIIRQTGVLGSVATLVAQQAEPYRRPGQWGDLDVPIGSRIVRAVNAYDDLVTGSIETSRRLQALERLRLGVAFDYDPRVVEALSVVVERSARLGV